MSDDLTLVTDGTRRVGGLLMRFARFSDGVLLLTFGTGPQTALIQIQLLPHEQRTLGQLLLDQDQADS